MLWPPSGCRTRDTDGSAIDLIDCDIRIWCRTEGFERRHRIWMAVQALISSQICHPMAIHRSIIRYVRYIIHSSAIRHSISLEAESELPK